MTNSKLLRGRHSQIGAWYVVTVVVAQRSSSGCQGVPSKLGTYGVARGCLMGSVAACGDDHVMTNSKLLRGRHSQIGAWYVVTVVASQRRPMFRDAATARCVIEAIDYAAAQVETAAWTVMPDHVHWMFTLRHGALGRAVQALKSRSTLGINRLMGTQGPVWQRGYYEHRVRHHEDLVSQARYLIANPLRAGLVTRLTEYPFWWCGWAEAENDL